MRRALVTAFERQHRLVGRVAGAKLAGAFGRRVDGELGNATRRVMTNG
jgi:hypothetical protein